MNAPAEPAVLRPNPGAQERFLQCGADEALFGGGLGAGKSLALLMCAAQDAGNPKHRALLLRRTFPELRDSLLPESWTIYPAMGGTYANKTWRFPSGATVDLRSMEHEKDKYNFQSAQYTFIGWDQLETFTQGQYEFMWGRLRTPDPKLRPVMRAAANAVGPHVDWVLKRWRWWLYQPGVREDEFDGPYVPSNTEALVLRDPSTGEEQVVLASASLRCTSCGARWRATEAAPAKRDKQCEHLSPITRAFFPAVLEDNPKLPAADYERRLDQLDPHLRHKLRFGDWMAQDTPGDFFQRQWFAIADAGPAQVRARCRYWDRAATPEGAAHDPDWTVGLLLSVDHAGVFYVEDVVRQRLAPAGVQSLIEQTAQLDAERDRRTTQVLEEDPGQAGKVEMMHLIRALAGHDVRAVRPSGDKVTRARPVAAQAHAGNVRLVRGGWEDGEWRASRWIQALLAELDSFPGGRHNDQVDALSGALGYLTGSLPRAAGAGYRGRGHRKPGLKFRM